MQSRKRGFRQTRPKHELESGIESKSGSNNERDQSPAKRLGRVRAGSTRRWRLKPTTLAFTRAFGLAQRLKRPLETETIDAHKDSVSMARCREHTTNSDCLPRARTPQETRD